MLFNNRLRNKILSLTDLQSQTKKLKQEGKKIVFTNGCFDILHPGHVDYLSRARDLGDFLILGLNTDASVKRLGKGDNRPVNSEESRAMVLAGLESVDAIVYFEDDTPLNLITSLIPDVLVKGGDYTIDTIVGSDVVQAAGGRVVTIPFLEGYSTTRIINRITDH